VHIAALRWTTFGGKRPVLLRVDAESDDDLVAIVRHADTGEAQRIILRTDGEGLVSGLLFQPAIEHDARRLTSWEELDGELASLAGHAAFVAMELDDGPGEGEPGLRFVHAYNAADRLAIGSTFKLWVLGALAEKVRAGEASWDEALEIREALRSTGSAGMQNEPAGAEFSVRRHAELMISISDNTATDHLIAYVGREHVEAYMSRLHAEPSLNLPFLTTGEIFRLKLNPDRSVLERYIEADEAARRAMLASREGPMAFRPGLLQLSFWSRPIAIGTVEWFASPVELCRVMVDLRRLERIEGLGPVGEVLRMNPGIPFGDRWKSVAFKGGSEPGVVNLTWLLERSDGRWFVLSFGWNDPQALVDTMHAVKLSGRAADLLSREPEPVPPSGCGGKEEGGGRVSSGSQAGRER
jgi:hypothetical protein